MCSLQRVCSSIGRRVYSGECVSWSGCAYHVTFAGSCAVVNVRSGECALSSERMSFGRHVQSRVRSLGRAGIPFGRHACSGEGVLSSGCPFHVAGMCAFPSWGLPSLSSSSWEARTVSTWKNHPIHKWVWVKTKPLGDRRFSSLVTRATYFGVTPFLTHSHICSLHKANVPDVHAELQELRGRQCKRRQALCLALATGRRPRAPARTKKLGARPAMLRTNGCGSKIE